jgi:hypothetical protein
VCERECVCVRERERERECVCVRERERERETYLEMHGQYVCVCSCMYLALIYD